MLPLKSSTPILIVSFISFLCICVFTSNFSHCDRRFDGRVRIVADQFKILELEVVYVFHRRIQFHLRQRTRLARELQLRLLKMIGVEMQVAKGVDEVARLQSANLRDHQREQRVAGDVERHAQKNIRAALVKLAAQFTVAHIKLKHRMARRQGHAVNVGDIPRADYQAATVGIAFDFLDDGGDLINAPPAFSQARPDGRNAGAVGGLAEIKQRRLTCGVIRRFAMSAGFHPMPPLFSVNRP